MSTKNSMLFVITIYVICLANEKDSSRIEVSGWGYFTFGRVENSSITEQAQSADIDFNDLWFSDFDAGLKATTQIGEHARARLHFGITTGFPVLDHNKGDNAEILYRKFHPYLIDAALEHTISAGDHMFVTEFGYFPFKYNPHVKNLGEYLFRSTVYPPSVWNEYELPNEKLIGFHGRYSYDLSDNSALKADLLFTNEKKTFPLHDFDLSYIISGHFSGFLEFGFGLTHQHLIVLDEKLTTPAKDTLIFRKGTPSRLYTSYVDSSGDTTDYTFRGTNGMVRISLDPKAFIDTDIFGSEDLRLYSEVMIHGVKDYDGWYENTLERLRVTMGFNVPFFKLLDVCAVEAEYCDSPYWNTLENVWKHRSPVPYTGERFPDYNRFKPLKKDEWKWSIYASKTISDRIRISGQFASDHSLRNRYLTTAKYTEIVPLTKDWYWVTRIKYLF